MDLKPMTTCKYCGVELDEKSMCPLCGEVYREVKSSTPEIPTRAPFPSTEITDERSCSVCGFLLQDDSPECPMCNSPILSEEEETHEFRCPVCENPLDVNAIECPHCGINLHGKEEREELSYKCPICQEEMQVDDRDCRHCGTKIWLDLGEEIRRIQEYRCPVCDSQVQEDTEKCPECGSDIWMRDVEALKEEAASKIDEAVTQIQMERRETDSDLSNAIRFVKVAKKAFEMADFGRASRCAILSLDLARSAGLQKRILADALQRAERTVTLVDEKGGDVVKAMELLQGSKEEVQKGNYRKALKMAIRGKVLAESSIGQDAVLMIDADTLE